jgi:uncharacterized membrane protein YeaQ/YmgE (transglycosylase-associated protein family)
MGVVELVLVGLVVGGIARLVVPGRQPMGILMTLAVGVGGSLLGWWVGQHVVHAAVSQHPWLWAIGGAVLVVLAYSSFQRGSWRRGL